MPLLTSIYYGRKYVIPITYKVGGVAQDITGYTFTLMVKKLLTQDNSDAVLTKDADHVSAVDGTMQLVLEPEDTAAIRDGTYYYDFVAYDPDSKPMTIEQGTFVLNTPVNLPP